MEHGLEKSMYIKLVVSTIFFIIGNIVYMNIKINELSILACIIVEVVFIFYFAPKVMKNKVFRLSKVPKMNIIILYYLPFLYGYRSFDMAFVPHVVQARLYRLKGYEFKYDSIYDANFTYEIIQEKKGTALLNIIISDTFEVHISQLPEVLQKHDNIIIKRNEPTYERAYSKNLVPIFKDYLMDNINIYSEINIIFATNPKVVHKIVDQIIDGRTDKCINVLNCPPNNEKFNYFLEGSKKINLKKIRLKDLI